MIILYPIDFRIIFSKFLLQLGPPKCSILATPLFLLELFHGLCESSSSCSSKPVSDFFLQDISTFKPFFHHSSTITLEWSIVVFYFFLFLIFFFLTVGTRDMDFCFIAMLIEVFYYLYFSSLFSNFFFSHDLCVIMYFHEFDIDTSLNLCKIINGKLN